MVRRALALVVCSLARDLEGGFGGDEEVRPCEGNAAEGVRGVALCNEERCRDDRGKFGEVLVKHDRLQIPYANTEEPMWKVGVEPKVPTGIPEHVLDQSIIHIRLELLDDWSERSEWEPIGERHETCLERISARLTRLLERATPLSGGDLTLTGMKQRELYCRELLKYRLR
jgi:hypothetical protein